MHLKIALLGGDGIGPEVLAEAVKTLRSVADIFGHNFTFKKAVIGAKAINDSGSPLPQETIKVCKECDAVLFGAIGSLEYDNDPDAKIRPEQGLLQLRKELGLYANIRPIKVFHHLIPGSPLKKHIIKGTDFVIFRELTNGIYFNEKKLDHDGSHASDLYEYSESEISQIAHLAFKAAKKRSKKLTLVDKANVLETSRLWRRVVMAIAKSYPEVTLECIYIDKATTQMVLDPSRFDVILTDSFFGDILNDQASVLLGSTGILPSASIGSNIAMFEPVHGSYPQAAGKNIANPVASILSVALLLQHFGLDEESNAVVSSVLLSFNKGVVTSDILGSSKFGTDYVGDYIANNIVDSEDILTMNDENIWLGKSTII